MIWFKNIANSKKAQGIVLTVLLLAISAGVATYLVAANQKPFLSFDSLSQNASVEIFLTSAGKTTPLNLDKNGVLRIDTDNPAYDYTLAINVSDKNNNIFRDIVISYRTATGAATVMLDGFSTHDKIDIPEHKELSFDWSGKFEFTALAKAKPSTICITTTADIAFCHALPKRTAA